MQAQRQEGFSAVEVKITRGDLTPEQFRGLAAIMREFSGGYARSTVQQNLVLRWVRDESLYDVWQRLGRARPRRGRRPRDHATWSAAPAPTAANSGSPARWGSTGRSRSGSRQMEIADALTKRIQIKMSGCPNGCSQHHIANIGFYGASLKVGERQMPAYIPHIGGSYEGGEVIFGKRLKSRLPGQARPRGGRALGSGLRGRARRAARSSTPSPSGSAPSASKQRSRS